MNPEVKELWVTALRSGDYPQSKGHLAILTGLPHVSAGFCCLGVLCELAFKAGVEMTATNVVTDHYTLRSYDGSVGVLPESVLEWAGLPHGNPLIGENVASFWNDSIEKTFPEIADLIEEHL